MTNKDYDKLTQSIHPVEGEWFTYFSINFISDSKTNTTMLMNKLLTIFSLEYEYSLVIIEFIVNNDTSIDCRLYVEDEKTASERWLQLLLTDYGLILHNTLARVFDSQNCNLNGLAYIPTV